MKSIINELLKKATIEAYGKLLSAEYNYVAYKDKDGCFTELKQALETYKVLKECMEAQLEETKL